jgi:hypothetical protein
MKRCRRAGVDGRRFATLLKGKPSGRKRVAWGEPIPLADVKAIGKALGCSINDVLLACVAGAIAAWLREEGDDPAGKEIRAMVPVNSAPLDEAWELGNRFASRRSSADRHRASVERVLRVRARNGELKSSYQPLLAFAVLAVAGQMVQPVQDAILGLFAKKATAVMTNVPGPQAPLAFCGSTLRQTMFWVPASGEIGVGVSVLSYGGGSSSASSPMRHSAPSRRRSSIASRPEFEKLLLVTMMLPWGERGRRRVIAPIADRVVGRITIREQRRGDTHVRAIAAAGCSPPALSLCSPHWRSPMA